MKKISVNIENLETAVETFAFASKEAGEMNYRLTLLGNELVDDMDLQASPEYPFVMAAYSEASLAVKRINEFFNSLLLTVTKTPEMYSDAERKSLNRINSILKKSDVYQKAIVDNNALESIVQKAQEDDVNMDGLTDLINKGYQSTKMSDLSSEAVDSDLSEAEGPFSFGVTAAVETSFESTRLSSTESVFDENESNE